MSVVHGGVTIRDLDAAAFERREHHEEATPGVNRIHFFSLNSTAPTMVELASTAAGEDPDN